MVESDALEAAAIWVALHLILLLVLSVRVMLLRRKHLVGLGDGGIPPLTQAGRVFGNAAEYVPTFLAALILLALVDASAGVVHALGATMFLGRVAHAIGITRSPGASVPRVLGMALTWTAYPIAAGALLFYAL